MAEDKITQLGSTRSGFQPNIAAVLSYVLTVATGAIMLIIERENKFVRFHALQSILFGFVWMTLWILTDIELTRFWPNPIVGWIINDVVYFLVVLGGFVVWLVLLYKAHGGKRFKLPIIGKIAERIA